MPFFGSFYCYSGMWFWVNKTNKWTSTNPKTNRVNFNRDLKKSKLKRLKKSKRDLNDRWLSFKTILSYILNTEAPIRKINKRKQDPLPWYDDELKTRCEIMNEAHSKYCLSNTIEDHMYYKSTRNQYYSMIREKNRCTILQNYLRISNLRRSSFNFTHPQSQQNKIKIQFLILIVLFLLIK